MATMKKKSARIIAPGRIVERELEARSWTIETLATYSGLSMATIKGIIYDSKPITNEVAKGFARAFGTSIELWKNLESDYDMRRTSFA